VFFAHSTDDVGWQGLRDHLVAVAELASSRGGNFGAAKAAALAGLLHDLGKYTNAFQRRLDGSRESVDHSTAGEQEVRRLAIGGFDRGMAELVAYTIAGHHSGFPDREGEAGSLTSRLAKVLDPLNPIWRDSPLDAVGYVPHPILRQIVGCGRKQACDLIHSGARATLERASRPDDLTDRIDVLHETSVCRPPWFTLLDDRRSREVASRSVASGSDISLIIILSRDLVDLGLHQVREGAAGAQGAQIINRRFELVQSRA
jgi:CRISPR-associated endonuclease Cas3-HD